MTPEGRVKAKVDRLLAQYILWVFKPVQMGMGKPGLDYFIVANGKFCAVETKADDKELTPRQKITKREIESYGGADVIEIRSLDDEQGFYQLREWLDTNASTCRIEITATPAAESGDREGRNSEAPRSRLRRPQPSR